MRILVDTNVILDAILSRQPNAESAKNIITLFNNHKMKGYITANSIADIFYLAQKVLDKVKAKEILRSLLRIFLIISVDSIDCHKALDLPLEDFEDALVLICADKIKLDYVLTNDKGFLKISNPLVPVISPEDLLVKFK